MHLRSLALAATVFLAFAPAVHAAPATRDAVIDETLARIKADYVFPDRFGAIEQNVRRHQKAGDYAGAADERAFATLLTTHLQEVSHDKHMSLQHQPNAQAMRPAAFVSSPAQRDNERRENYGLRKVEVLPGNVGYLDVIQFHDNGQLCGETIAAAMGFLANTDALIIDLRSNRGGGEAMQLLASYLLDGSIDLMELRMRGRGTEHMFTQAYVPGKRYLDKPVYVLTSNRTFSAGEAFAYALQSLKRATLVGATTRGGGNPNELVAVANDYLLSVPIGESVSPVTGKSWDGVGVPPDVAVDEKEALAVAHRQALQALREASKDEAQRTSIGKALAALDKA
ncbi:S41 family peptidase [Massilia agilis]|uniref:S41 family peptidase n=1 Tax=Massilia agilis TaxID=1811226 RepID=A0ABT2DCQ2_9BURK|nr:S41 family peptidase [Massilia agilis]MCS0808937.1 S41 family peptidase [Massilia agilis]